MRDASNSVSLVTQIQSRIHVSIARMTTSPTPKELFVSLSPLCEPATGTGEARASRVHHRNSKTVNRCQQQDSVSEDASTMLLPTNQSFGIFHTHTSARTQCHGHRLSGFSGENVSLIGFRR